MHVYSINSMHAYMPVGIFCNVGVLLHLRVVVSQRVEVNKCSSVHSGIAKWIKMVENAFRPSCTEAALENIVNSWIKGYVHSRIFMI